MIVFFFWGGGHSIALLSNEMLTCCRPWLVS